MEPGYSKTPLAKKLGIKDGHSVLLINEPDHYLSFFEGLPEIIEAAPNETDIDFIHLFAKTLDELKMYFVTGKDKLSKNGSLWVSWPKKASKVTTDLNGNIVRSYGLDNGLVDVKVCAIDSTWSGLKFVYRTKDR